MLVLGLTGGIASGKSTVSKRLQEEYHITVIDADEIAHQIVEPGRPAYKKIVRYFGDKITDLILPDGTLNRPALGAYVFQNKGELQILNKITHGQVRKEMLWLMLCSWLKLESIVVLDVPLLFEAGMDIICGMVVSVVCEPKIQLQRLMERNPELSRAECEKRIASQMSNDDKIKRSDYVLDNNNSVEELNQKIDSVIRKVQPSLWVTLLEYIPFIGALFAIKSVARRWWKNYEVRRQSKTD
ncbi:hypothetical protein KL925_001163 [Ogataea polymorpha]|uniref:Uncharacterized protein n=1 Tax=Ogataea polymorpha TaxID=460523 RepID=A0A1B7SLP9_9ASCO|nr:uncharacterized protein OGAPODRAFT_23286 [Ogataea polymorpha]KAG7928982.1 hypothetical protein KL925_001163 [Ogataea polymorpha]KAG7938159.1 hypothetical protein KL934_000733 [Ogataea polymorpha]KAH3670014.1 hypothetical protein OGATHE_002827 [Ogataea polymorpha]OBA17402.1 hypothetical protein OGAPODRAFT_23286 [Ogataea polymorpha]